MRDSVNAYVSKDLELAKNVILEDDAVDTCFEEVKEQMIAYIKEEKGQRGKQIFDLIMVTKYLERIGDHATNIAEWVELSIYSCFVHFAVPLGKRPSLLSSCLLYTSLR